MRSVGDSIRLAGLAGSGLAYVFSEVLSAAKAGDAAAQVLLAQMYMEGKGVARNPEEAVLWYSLAANLGEGIAMNMLGRCHELGTGTPLNHELAAVWYQRAAESGLDWGMYNYANLLSTGRGVQRDRAKALELYRRAAEMGHAKSMNLLARHLEEGWETARDPDAALYWYRRSAEEGDFRGQASYASILLQQGSEDEAVRWLQVALDAGSPSFLSVVLPELLASGLPRITDLARKYAHRWAIDP